MPTNWITDNWILAQESGGDLLMQESIATDPTYISLQSYQDTVWAENTATGAG